MADVRSSQDTLIERLDLTREVLRSIAAGRSASIGDIGTEETFRLFCALYRSDMQTLNIGDHAAYRARDQEYREILLMYGRQHEGVDGNSSAQMRSEQNV